MSEDIKLITLDLVDISKVKIPNLSIDVWTGQSVIIPQNQYVKIRMWDS